MNELNELFRTGGASFLIAVILTPMVRDLFRSYNVVDRPGWRKMHVHPIPRVGGIAIAVAYLGALLLLGRDDKFAAHAPMIWKLIPGAAIIFFTGLIDDFFNLRPSHKLAAEIVAASLVFSLGLRIETVANISLPLWVSFPVTVFWLLLCTNALNLVDGLDGLCAGMGLMSTLTLFAGALLLGEPTLAYATFPLVGALLGFLCFNFNPATVFLGDSGALLIGFLQGCFGMIWTQKSAALMSLTVPLLALTIPLLDVALSVVRRFLMNRPIFAADRGHIHHRLIDMGLSPRRAVLILYLVASLIAAIALLIISPDLGHYRGVLFMALFAITFFSIRQLRYTEFRMARQVLFGGGFQRNMKNKFWLHRLRESLRAAGSEQQWWEAVVESARAAGWIRVSWTRPAGEWKEELAPQTDPSAWTLRVALPPEGFITLEGLAGPNHTVPLLEFVDELCRSFPEKPFFDSSAGLILRD